MGFDTHGRVYLGLLKKSGKLKNLTLMPKKNDEIIRGEIEKYFVYIIIAIHL